MEFVLNRQGTISMSVRLGCCVSVYTFTEVSKNKGLCTPGLKNRSTSHVGSKTEFKWNFKIKML